MRVSEDIARSLGAPLCTAEQAWTCAVREGAELVAAFARASIEAEASISLVSDLVDRGVEGLQQLGAVGRTYASIHDRMSALARQVGLDPTAYGRSIEPKGQVVELGGRDRRAA